RLDDDPWSSPSGGSVFLTGEKDAEFLRQLVEGLRAVAKQHPLAVVVGGGKTAREYIRLGRELGLTEIELDELGIDVTRLNARLLASLLAPACPARPLTSVREAVEESSRWSLVVLGGTEPGHTTDAVAALLAERMRAERLVNATRSGGIYDRDPATDPAATLLKSLTFPQFRAMVEAGTDGRAGQEFIFDRLGVERLARARIPLAVVQGRDVEQLRNALLGKVFRGS
ncbi:putative Uridylate kinase, archaeal/spirochete, partial [mine drainage metagenome]